MERMLMHSGSKGQKWGIRRYRNYDGTLTPLGKERYYAMSDEQRGRVAEKEMKKAGKDLHKYANFYGMTQFGDPWFIAAKESTLEKRINRANKHLRTAKDLGVTKSEVNAVLGNSVMSKYNRSVFATKVVKCSLVTAGALGAGAGTYALAKHAGANATTSTVAGAIVSCGSSSDISNAINKHAFPYFTANYNARYIGALKEYMRQAEEIMEHSGVKGQKWHVRRYQNPDGTLTPEGKIHYQSMRSEEKKELARELSYDAGKSVTRAQSVIATGDARTSRLNERNMVKRIADAKKDLKTVKELGLTKKEIRKAFEEGSRDYEKLLVGQGYYIDQYKQFKRIQTGVFLGGPVFGVVGAAMTKPRQVPIDGKEKNEYYERYRKEMKKFMKEQGI